MMKLQLNRIIVPLVLVVGCTTMCTTIQAQATEPQTFYGESSLPRYAAIERLTATLKINSSGRVSCGGSASTILGYSCDATMKLQQKVGTSWETVKEWTSSGTTNNFAESWYVASGYDYRVEILADVYNSSGNMIESQTTHSSVVEY